MAGPIAATGAISSPTKYGALTMGGEEFTGLWRQRSPYRDAATAYLMKKFYQGSRFDSIWDGLNREITCRLTDARRPGNKVYNSNACPPIYSYFSWKYIQNGIEQLRVIADCQDGTIRDVTAGQLSTLYTKAAGAGRARFYSSGTELFFGDGVEQKKIMRSSKVWTANTPYNAGDFIIDPNGNVQVVQVVTTANVTNVAVGHVPFSPHFHYYVQFEFAIDVNWPAGTKVSFTGLTTYPLANGQTLTVTNPGFMFGGIGTGPNIATFSALTSSDFPSTAETGTAVATNVSGAAGTSGATQPAPWNPTLGGTTSDGTLTWQNFGPPVYDWQTAAPTQAPTITPNPNNRQWRAISSASLWYSIIDTNGDVQVAIRSNAGTFITGGHAPSFGTSLSQLTTDNDVVWVCCGRPTTWLPSTVFQTWACINDSNGNLQIVTAGGGGSSGSTPPATWASTIGATTTDGAITWTCVGTGTQLLTGTRTYAFAYHTIDGGISTASPLVPLNPASQVLGAAGNYYAQLSGPTTADRQIDQIWIYATAQGQATPLLLAQIPNPNIGTAATWTYVDRLPDTALNPFIQAPLADSADPPPTGLTGPVQHLQRVWGFVGNRVYYSAGPDAIPTAGNGNTAWPPLNTVTYPSMVLRLIPITVDNGALLVFTTGGIYIILGLGTAANPFYSTDYCKKITLAGYDALDVFGTEIFLMEGNAKVSSFKIGYPFDPQSGYTEVGFPIGDQFIRCMTGGFNGSIFTPSSTYVSWNVAATLDTAMYVANGAGQWFRMSMVSPPESGIVWSPIASIAGGTSAVQSVETAPGVWNLLLGPATTGPILVRDGVSGTQYTDNGTAYPSWDSKGVNLLCSTGQTTEVAHIAAKYLSLSRPIVSVLLGEIAPTTERPWNVLEWTSNDPPLTPRSTSVFSDRWGLAQNGVADTGDCILTMFDFGTQANISELLDWGIYGATEDERKEEAQKV